MGLHLPVGVEVYVSGKCFFIQLSKSLNKKSIYLIEPLPLLLKVIVKSGNTKGGSITVLLTSCLTGLELAV